MPAELTVQSNGPILTTIEQDDADSIILAGINAASSSTYYEFPSDHCVVLDINDKRPSVMSCSVSHWG
jgi:hypothetical protein